MSAAHGSRQYLLTRKETVVPRQVEIPFTIDEICVAHASAGVEDSPEWRVAEAQRLVLK